jgi:uroporphyrinogen III methyltransferase/synthase
MLKMNKRPEQPLAGNKVIVTRAHTQASELVHAIESLGGQAIVCSSIETVALPVTPVLHDAIASIHTYDSIIFTSVNAVRFFFAACSELGINLASLNKVKGYAVGPKTAEAMLKFGITPEQLPDLYHGEQLAEQFNAIHHQRQRVLLPRALIVREKLLERLRSAGHEVNDIAIYETVRTNGKWTETIHLLSNQMIDMITFTSPSTIAHFLENLSQQGINEPLQLMRHLNIFCIGPITAEAATEQGLHITGVARESTVESLLELLKQHNMNKRDDHS